MIEGLWLGLTPAALHASSYESVLGDQRSILPLMVTAATASPCDHEPVVADVDRDGLLALELGEDVSVFGRHAEPVAAAGRLLASAVQHHLVEVRRVGWLAFELARVVRLFEELRAHLGVLREREAHRVSQLVEQVGESLALRVLRGRHLAGEGHKVERCVDRCDPVSAARLELFQELGLRLLREGDGGFLLARLEFPRDAFGILLRHGHSFGSLPVRRRMVARASALSGPPMTPTMASGIRMVSLAILSSCCSKTESLRPPRPRFSSLLFTCLA